MHSKHYAESMRSALRVILMELLLILMFAAVACRLFQEYDSFHDLSTAWLSLFELTTTVVNPSLWMPMYAASKASAFYFVFFIVTSVFYLYLLVLSVVFQTYIHATTEIHFLVLTFSARLETLDLWRVTLHRHTCTGTAPARFALLYWKMSDQKN